MAEEQQFYPMPPSIGSRSRPTSVRGDTKINFHSTIRLSSNNPPMDDIMSEGSICSSNRVFSPSIRPLDHDGEDDTAHEDALYRTMFEILLRRKIGRHSEFTEADRLQSGNGLLMICQLSAQLSEDMNL
jgi:hypothetical protein